MPHVPSQVNGTATVDDNLEAHHLHLSADTGFRDHLGPMYHLNVKLMKIMKTIHKTHRDHLTFTCAKDSPMFTLLRKGHVHHIKVCNVP